MKKGYVYIVLTAFLFSTIEITSKLIGNSISPFQLIFLRFIIGGIVFLPFTIIDIKKRDIHFNRKDFLFFSLTGFLSIVISMSLFQLAIVLTKASTVAVIFSTNPIYTIPLAFLMLNEKISKKTIISLIFSLGGILFILNPFNLNPDFKGILITIAASVTFSLYSVISKPKLDRYGSLILNCFTFIIGDAILFLFLIIFKIPVLSGITRFNILPILYLGIFTTGFGYLLYFKAMEETSAIASSMLFFIKPALAPILAFIILRESIPLNTVMGILFILIGSYINIAGKNIKKKLYADAKA